MVTIEYPCIPGDRCYASSCPDCNSAIRTLDAHAERIACARELRRMARGAVYGLSHADLALPSGYAALQRARLLVDASNVIRFGTFEAP